MTDVTRRISRRTFVMGFGGSAASAALLLGLWEFRRWPRMPGKEHPVIAGCCAYAEYDGWLVTTEDKRRLPFVLTYTSGWYPKETGSGIDGAMDPSGRHTVVFEPAGERDVLPRLRRTREADGHGRRRRPTAAVKSSPMTSGRRRCRRILHPRRSAGKWKIEPRFRSLWTGRSCQRI